MNSPIKHIGFQPKNYKILLIGLGINILGFLLMIGGGSDDLNKFNANELFSTVRITIAPMLIIAGYIVILYSIMKKEKAPVDKGVKADVYVLQAHKTPEKIQAQTPVESNTTPKHTYSKKSKK